MLYPESEKVVALKRRLESFMDRHVYPNEERFYKEAEELGPRKVYPIVEELKPKARSEGLWNLFLPESDHGAGLTNLEYAPLCEIMGRSHLAAELFGAGHGQHGVLARYGTKEHQERWLKPLLAGEIRSCFAMTEPAVASSDATNIESSIVINGRKWYTTNATDPRCKICIFMGKTDPDDPGADGHARNRNAEAGPRVRLLRRARSRFRGCVQDVRIPVTNMLLGQGRGFEFASGRSPHQPSRSEVPSPGRWIGSGRHPGCRHIQRCDHAFVDWPAYPPRTPSGDGLAPIPYRSTSPASG